MTIKDASVGMAQRLAAVGALVGALAASSCCMVPLLLFSVGVGGAWIGNLTRLAPYQPYFLAAAGGCLGCGYWLRYRASKGECAGDDACARPMPQRLVKTALVLATVLVALALSFDFLVPRLLNS
jgi:mercuric ion transport protein